MKAADRRVIASAGVEGEYVSHSTPQAAIDKLLPALIHLDKIEIEQGPGRSSSDFIADITKHGGQVTSYPFRYYRQNTMAGKNRKLDNTDIIIGKEPLYGDFTTFLATHKRVKALVTEMLAYYRSQLEKGSMLAQTELEDLEKITIQAWRMTGYFVDSPISSEIIPKLDSFALSTLTTVAKKYVAELKRAYPAIYQADFKTLIALDADPPDTMTGVPTLASGSDTLVARREILANCPVPTPSNARNYHLGLDTLGATLGLAPGLIYSPVLSTRMGPLKKPTNLYTTSQGAGYQSRFTAVGMYNRVRNVYPAPYHVNFMLSPIYVWMSHARKAIPGLWHDPASQDQYIARLRAQGKYAYALDFSGMDTAMNPNVIMGILTALRNAGFPSWSLDMFATMYPNMGVTLPSIYNLPGDATYITGMGRPWCSGFKLTSEFDTIYGLSVLLTALSDQIPDIIDQWVSGRFVIAELGDDIFFTSPKPLNLEAIGAKALNQWGATLKAIEDSMFLKWILPFNDEVKTKTRPFSRLIQQTFFNEDRYSGVEGGDKPPAILRVGLISRLTAMKDHPDWNRWWPELYSIIITLPPFAETSPEWKAKLREGIPALDKGDEVQILEYARKVPSYFQGLVDRAKFEPSSAHTLLMLKELGLGELSNPPEAAIRSILLRALFENPSPSDRIQLRSRVATNYQ